MPGTFQTIDRLVQSRASARYAAAAALVLGTVIVRFLLEPLMVGSLGMAFFYPAVILAAYWLGARPAVLTAVLSTAAVLVFQAASTGVLTMNSVNWVILLLFAITSALAIYLLSHIRNQLRQLADRNDRVEALALSQADLFREHSGRVTDHLQLIAAILEVRAATDAEPDAARILTNAASRTLLISRMHREFSGDAGGVIDFPAFARRLADAANAASGLAGRRVEITGSVRPMMLEQATGLGLVMLDRLNAAPGAATVAIADTDGRIDFEMAVDQPGAASPAARDILLMEAVATQMRGALDLSTDAGRLTVRLSLPAGLQPPPAWTPLEQVVH